MQTPSPDSSSNVFNAATPAGDPKRGKRKSPAKPWIITGSCVVAVAAAYFGAAALISSQVPADATIAGVNIGSLNQDEARTALESEVVPLAQEPLKLTINDKDYTLDPVKAGLSLNVERTISDLTDFEINPVKLYERLTGDFSTQAVIEVDQDKLTAQLEKLAETADTKVAEGTIVFKDGRATLTDPVQGVELNVADAAAQITQGWEIAGPVIDLPAKVVEPEVSAQKLQAFYDQQVTSLLKGDVTLVSGEKTTTVSPKSMAAAATYAPADGEPKLSLDDEKLYAAATKNSDLSSTAKDAKIVLKDGKPSIQKSVKGISLETKDLGTKVLAASQSENRQAEVAMTETDAEFTTEDAQKLGIKEEIVEFSTPYPTYDTVRTKNLKAGSARVTGIVIKPGERFSLLDALGPITTANGYFSSGVVENGFSAEAVGGGLSQISTQMYNVGFLAGYDDITHKPHSRWFDRYPAGREATLWEGQVDMVWENNTPYGVMIQAWVSDNEVHTRLWSTKYWKVSQDSSGKYNQTDPTTVHNSADQCIPESGGKKGFSIDITRYRETIDGSKKLPAETKSWTYSPWNKIVCD